MIEQQVDLFGALHSTPDLVVHIGKVIQAQALDHFSAVYDKFARGLRRDEMINLLLDHCRRKSEDAVRLSALLQ